MNLKHSPFFLFTITLLVSFNFPINSSKADPIENNQSPPHHDINNMMDDMKDMKEGMKDDHHHGHKSLEISNDSNVPSVDIEVYPDKVSGWNLEIKTTNFTFTPQELNQSSNPNQGHAHLYLNGKKVTRIYGNWHYISQLAEGENEIKVILNTNNHEDLVYQGKMISDRIMVENK